MLLCIVSNTPVCIRLRAPGAWVGARHAERTTPCYKRYARRVSSKQSYMPPYHKLHTQHADGRALFHCVAACHRRRAVVFFGSIAAALAPEACFEGWESHCVVALPPSRFGYPAIVAAGTGTRGAIYGAYTFAEIVLGA